MSNGSPSPSWRERLSSPITWHWAGSVSYTHLLRALGVSGRDRRFNVHKAEVRSLENVAHVAEQRLPSRFIGPGRGCRLAYGLVRNDIAGHGKTRLAQIVRIRNHDRSHGDRAVAGKQDGSDQPHRQQIPDETPAFLHLSLIHI